MRSYKLAVLYGVLASVASLVVLDLIVPDPSALMRLVTSEDQMFFIMKDPFQPMVLSICGVLFSVLYFRKVERNFLREGAALGVIWFAISAMLPVMRNIYWLSSGGSAHVEWLFGDILMYLMYPIITLGFGGLLKVREEITEEEIAEEEIQLAPDLPES